MLASCEAKRQSPLLGDTQHFPGRTWGEGAAPARHGVTRGLVLVRGRKGEVAHARADRGKENTPVVHFPPNLF